MGDIFEFKLSPKQHPKPCNECIFRRESPRGCDNPPVMGGSAPTVYIGQTRGPFYIPCHKCCDFTDPNWKNDHTINQCAGAAIYRANCGYDLPVDLLFAPADLESVFASPQEFLAHHMGMSLEAAQVCLAEYPAEFWMLREFQKMNRLQGYQVPPELALLQSIVNQMMLEVIAGDEEGGGNGE